MDNLLLLELYVWWILAVEHGISASSMNEKLQTFLFEDYNKHIRPSRRFDDVLRVDFYLTLLQLISVDEKSEEMTTSQYITLRWYDRRLSWSPREFGGIEGIRVPSQVVWKPDLALSNNIDGHYDKTVPVNALLNYTGLVEWIPPAIYKSSCRIQVEYFPFDWQNCTLRFRSFTYSSREIKMHSVYSKVVVDKEAYTDNGEWQIIHCPVKINVRNEEYEDIVLYFIIQRKPLFYIINIIVPCVLISSLSVLVFYLPSGCSEKTNMSISVLLGLPVYLLLLAKRVPETSLAVPLIGTYLLFTMLSVTFSVIFSVVVLNIHHRSSVTHEMAPWVRTIFVEFLPQMLHMDVRFTKKTKGAKEQRRVREFSVRGQAISFVKPSDQRFNDIGRGKERRSSADDLRECVETVTPNIKRLIEYRSAANKRKLDSLAKSPDELQPIIVNQLSEDQEVSQMTVRNDDTDGADDQEYFRLTCNSRPNASPASEIRNAYFDIHSVTRKDEILHTDSMSRLSVAPPAFGGAFFPVECTLPPVEKDGERHSPLKNESTERRHRPLSPGHASKNKRNFHRVTNRRSNPLEPVRVKRVIHALPESANGCLQAVDFICHHVRDQKKRKEESHEWRIVAMVLDYLLFWTFLLVYISGSLYFAIQALTNFPPDHPFHSGEPKYASCWEEHEHLVANRRRSFFNP